MTPAGVCYLFGLKDDVSELFRNYCSIPFMRRSVSKLMFIPSRSFSFLLLFLFFTSSAWLGNGASAQTFKNLEGAVSILGQFSQSSNGNGVQDNPTDSLGALATVRQSFHPWLGYEVNYSYTRFSERYSTIPFAVQSNLHEVSGAYLLQGPTIPLLGLQPFGAVGVGALIFLPTTVGGQKYNQQARVPILYEVGVNYPILTSHLGLRLQYRGLSYKTPDFNSAPITTNSRRQTSEPSVGAYLRF
jgi:opacity protein-like surface antigen